MSTRDEDRRRYESNRARIAENERVIARALGRMEATYEGLPRDEALIAEAMRETGADRERVVQSLQAISERELARLHDESPAPGPGHDAPLDPAVERFREMLS